MQGFGSTSGSIVQVQTTKRHISPQVIGSTAADLPQLRKAETLVRRTLRVADLMKITSAFCDVHTTAPLVPATVEMVSVVGDHNVWETAKCSDPACSRNFTRTDGYFDCMVGQPPNVADRSYKPRCGWNHEVEFMVLTEIDGELKWACPAEDCDHTLPFRIYTKSKCPYENCGKPTSHTFEVAKLKKVIDRKAVSLYCYHCDRSWIAGDMETGNLAKFLGELCPQGVVS